MIEFKKDGVCGDDAERHAELKTLVIGLGQAGVNIVDQFVIHGLDQAGRGLELLALDSDQTVIEGSVSPDKILLGQSLTRGLGCAGDLDRAKALWKLESPRLLPRLEGVRQVVVAAGLGGATGSLFAVEIAKAVRRQVLPTRVVAVCALPFSFEAEGRQAVARRALADLRTHCDAVLAVANDRVDAWPEARQNIRHGLHGLNLELAQAAEAATQIMAEGGMNPITFADLRSLFGRFGGAEVPENCWIGRASTHVEEGPEALVERALHSPLLGGETAWANADSCIACVVGGHDFSLGQLKAISKVLQGRLPVHLPLMIGARTADRHEGRTKLILLLAATRAPQQDQPEIHLPEPAAAPVLPLQAQAPKSLPIPEPVIDLEEEALPASQAEIMPVIVPLPSRKPRRQPEPVVDSMEEVPAPAAFTPRAEAQTRPAAVPGRRAKPVKQEELPFEAGSRGRFENSLETIHNGENLDQPTFRRRRLAIKA